LYAAVGELGPELDRPHDIVITVFHDTILDTPQFELSAQLKKQLKEADAL
jgi:hypothetical protein